jgi:hypothetical protein
MVNAFEDMASHHITKHKSRDVYVMITGRVTMNSTRLCATTLSQLPLSNFEGMC